MNNDHVENVSDDDADDCEEEWAFFVPKSVLVEDNKIHFQDGKCTVYWTTEGMFVIGDYYEKAGVPFDILLRRVLVALESADRPGHGHAMPLAYQNFILRQVLGDSASLPPYPS